MSIDSKDAGSLDHDLFGIGSKSFVAIVTSLAAVGAAYIIFAIN